MGELGFGLELELEYIHRRHLHEYTVRHKHVGEDKEFMRINS